MLRFPTRALFLQNLPRFSGITLRIAHLYHSILAETEKGSRELRRGFLVEGDWADVDPADLVLDLCVWGGIVVGRRGLASSYGNYNKKCGGNELGGPLKTRVAFGAPSLLLPRTEQATNSAALRATRTRAAAPTSPPHPLTQANPNPI